MEKFTDKNFEKMSQREMYYYYILLKAKYLSHRKFEEIDEGLYTLAKSGCLVALTSYFEWQDSKLWRQDLIELAKDTAFIDDEENIPEQWELLMNLHKYDSVGLYGYENITSYKEFISEFIKVRAEFASMLKKAYLIRMSGIGFFDRNAYFEVKTKYEYFYSAIKNRPFTKCLINAQMGYFKRFLKYGFLSDYEAGLRLVMGLDLIDHEKDKVLNLTNIPSKVLEKLKKKAENTFQRCKKEKRLPIDSALAWSNIKQMNLNGESKIAEKMIDLIAEKPVFDEKIVENGEKERVL